MFYSHQLLARKAPLGQIWMAATMHAKINRRKLDKLNIIHVCEQILNPSVPMALRLSGILMGGVVIVYERKVKLFYDDVTRLLLEINEAWKVKAAPDPTVLPKGKSQAKKEAVTLPEKTEADVRDIEQSLNISNTANMGFQQTAYFAMRLDSVGEPYINNGLSDDDLAQNFHRGLADAENINLFERFDSYQTSTNIFNRFERFDIEGEEETHINFTSGDHVEIPNTLVLTPSPKDETIRADEGQYGENAVNQRSDECKEAALNQQKQRPVKRKTREAPKMDYEQTIIPGHIYQSWLQDASDIASRICRKRKLFEVGAVAGFASSGIMSTTTVVKLLDLPPTVLIDHLSSIENWGVHYPAPLMELWIKSTKLPHDLPSERNSPHLRPELSSLSPPDRVPVLDPIENAFQHFDRGLGSEPMGFPLPVEKQRPYPINDEEIFMGELQANLFKNGGRINEVNSVTPGNSGDDVRSIPSLGSGYGVLSQRSETNSERSNKKRPFSASSHNGSGLEPVAEEHFGKHPEPDFKLSRLSENGPTPDIEELMETGPTQTQNPIISQPVDKITDSIRTQMKNHFETPGAPQEESLNNLAAGMNRKGAALLFYQTCVLASRDFLKVEQNVPYGEILISKGAKM